PTFSRSSFDHKIIKRLADTPAGKSNLVAITGVTLLGSPGTSGDFPRRIQVSRYEYATGLTWRTMIEMNIELNAGTVVAYTADANRPTPLGEDEIDRAIKFASEDIPGIAQEPRTKINTVAVIQSSKASPLYAHRLVAIWAEGVPPVRRALVDLTMKKVVKDF